MFSVPPLQVVVQHQWHFTIPVALIIDLQRYYDINVYIEIKGPLRLFTSYFAVKYHRVKGFFVQLLHANIFFIITEQNYQDLIEEAATVGTISFFILTPHLQLHRDCQRHLHSCLCCYQLDIAADCQSEFSNLYLTRETGRCRGNTHIGKMKI